MSPAASDPLAGLAPLPPDLLADLSKRAGTSPFASGGYVRPARRPRPLISDSGRRGLDWERYPSLEAFYDTALEVISAPAEAFAKMRRAGGIGNPLGYLTVASVLGQLLLLIEAFLLLGGFLLLAQGGIINVGRPITPQWDYFFLLFGGAALLLIPSALMAACIGGFISAVFFHITLMICGAANAGFEATYRVVAFGIGSVYILIAIPIVGPLFATIIQPLVLIYGFMFAHETDGWRALIAVILPPFLAIGFVAVLFVVLGSTAAILVPAGS
jgi:hypothetical protein